MTIMHAMSRRLAAGIALVGAICLFLGAAVLPWWSGDDAGAAVRVDLGGLTLCGDQGCRTASLTHLGSGAATWARVATAAQIGGVAVAALAALVAAAALVGRQSRAASRAAALLAFFAGALGIAVIWSGPDTGVAPDFGIACYLAGAALVAAAASSLPRAR